MSDDYTKHLRQNMRGDTRVPDDELNIDRPPRGIRMEQTPDGGTVVNVRMFGAQSFVMLAPALFWNGLVSVFVCAAIDLTAKNFGWTMPDWFLFKMDEGGKGEAPVPWWFLWLFLAPFISIGIAFMWNAFFGFFGKCVIRLSYDEGSVFSGIGILGRTRRFAPKSVKSVDKGRIFTVNGRFFFGWKLRPAPRPVRGDETLPFLTLEMKNGREINVSFQ
ncbi:MAG: hypothetical protein FWG50_06480, partial [Kiritimatiellaeota bacterium]|nr:hypothetical protein [Kiritimatiellota bacterium]